MMRSEQVQRHRAGAALRPSGYGGWGLVVLAVLCLGGPGGFGVGVAEPNPRSTLPSRAKAAGAPPAPATAAPGPAAVAGEGAPGATAPGPAVPGPAAVQLRVQGDTLSATYTQQPLGTVLSELARQAGLTVYISAADAQQLVSATFAPLPLTEGIKRILQHKNYVLITEPTAPAAGKPAGQRLAKIRVLSPGAAYTTLTGRTGATPAAAEQAPVEEAATGEEEAEVARWRREVVEAKDAETRAAALEALDERRHAVQDLQALAESALKDTAPQVREVALAMLPSLVAEPEVLVGHLVELAQQDASPALRIDALSYLVATRDGSVTQHLQQALQDPAPEVRTMAQQLLEFVRQQQAEEPAPDPRARDK